MFSVDARFELAESLAEHDEHDAAMKLLKDANDLEPRGDKLPSAEMMDKIRIRLGACQAAKKEWDAALGYFEAVANNPKSPLVAQGLYRAGEVYLAKGDPAKAIERLTPSAQGRYQNLPGVDRPGTAATRVRPGLRRSGTRRGRPTRRWSAGSATARG